MSDDSDVEIEADHEASAVEQEETIDFQPNLVLKGAKSEVWKFLVFKGTKSKGPSKDKVYCRLCIAAKKESELPYSGGTTNLATHLKKDHPEEFSTNSNKELPPKITSFFGAATNNNVHKWPKTSAMWKRATGMIATWLCKDSRPSYLVQDKGFRDLLGILCPEFEVPCYQTITNLIKDIYEEKKKEVTENLEEPEFISVTTDGGTSSNAVSFLETNAHYLDKDLNMKYHTLGVRENKEKHTAENYRLKNDELLDEFKVKGKVVKVVTDNENKMKKAYNDKEREGCIAHILHSSITAGCEKVAVVKSTIDKTRKIAKKHNKSYALRYGLQAAQRKRKLKVRPLHQDVATRWGSTRYSMESFLDEKEDKENNPMEEDEDDDPELFINSQAINEALRGIKYKKKNDVYDFLLDRSHMNRIKNIHQLFTKLDIFTTTLGGAKYVTISVVLPVVKSMMKLLQPEDDDVFYIAELKSVILKDFKERIQLNLDLDFLIKTVALDPRFKNMKAVEVKTKREKVFKDLGAEMKEHLVKQNVEIVDDAKQQGEKKRKLCLDFPESDDDEEAAPDAISKEVEAYRAEPMQDRDGDPLAWWRKRKEIYPNLVRLVR